MLAQAVTYLSARVETRRFVAGQSPSLSGGSLLGGGRLGRWRIGGRAVSVDATILFREHGGDAQHDLIRRALEVVAAALLARLTQRHRLAVAYMDSRRPGTVLALETALRSPDGDRDDGSARAHSDQRDAGKRLDQRLVIAAVAFGEDADELALGEETLGDA